MQRWHMGLRKTARFWWKSSSHHVGVIVIVFHICTLHGRMCYLVLFNCNNFATSEALAEVCALLSAILVKHCNYTFSSFSSSFYITIQFSVVTMA